MLFEIGQKHGVRTVLLVFVSSHFALQGMAQFLNTKQARIQDFVMGGGGGVNICNNVIEPKPGWGV